MPTRRLGPPPSLAARNRAGTRGRVGGLPDRLCVRGREGGKRRRRCRRAARRQKVGERRCGKAGIDIEKAQLKWWQGALKLGANADWQHPPASPPPPESLSVAPRIRDAVRPRVERSAALPYGARRLAAPILAVPGQAVPCRDGGGVVWQHSHPLRRCLLRAHLRQQLALGPPSAQARRRGSLLPRRPSPRYHEAGRTTQRMWQGVLPTLPPRRGAFIEREPPQA